MKTIQEYLRELDRDKLVDTYLYEYPLDFNQLENCQDRTVRELRNTVKERLLAFVDTLADLEPVPTENKSIFIAFRYIRDDFDDVTFTLINAKDLEGDLSKVQGYAIEFNKQAEVMSFYVSNAPLTQRYIYELAAHVIYEASFFGFEQEDLEEELDKLKNSVEEVENGSAELTPYEDVFADLYAELGIEPDEESEDEHELHMKVIDARIRYSEHSKTKELRVLKDLLENEGFEYKG